MLLKLIEIYLYGVFCMLLGLFFLFFLIVFCDVDWFYFIEIVCSE